MTPQAKFNILQPIIEASNVLHGDLVSIKICEDCAACEIVAPDGRFSGTLLQDIASLASVYNWSFGVYRPMCSSTRDDGRLYILI